MKQKIETIYNRIKKYAKTNILFFSFIISVFINGTLLRFLTVGNFFDIKPALADIAFILLIGSITYLFKHKGQVRYLMTLSIIMTAICVINSMYYTFYKSFASVSLLVTSLFVIDVGDAVVENVIEYKDFIFIWQPIFMIIMHNILKRKNYYSKVAEVETHEKRFKKTFITSIVIGSIFILTLTSLEITKISSQWNREYILMHYGTYTYQASDIILSSTSSVNFLGFDEAYVDFIDYYENQEELITNNEYSGIFEGKNVLFIHAESVQNIAMELEFYGQEVTPNLNQLADEGLYFSNYYAPVSTGTSSDSEFMIATSQLPAKNGTVFVNYYENDYETMQEAFKEKDYYTFSMHGNVGSFWNRDTMYEELGYDYFYDKDDYIIDETIGLGLSDKSFFRQSVEKIKEIDSTYSNYYGTLIMLTNHTPFNAVDQYGEFDVTMSYKAINDDGEIEEIKAPYLEGSVFGNYLKSVHYSDDAIGELIDGLDAEGLLDDTVIVIYGDHDARFNEEEYERLYNYDPYTDSVIDEEDSSYQEIDFYLYEKLRQVPFIIWSKDDYLSTEITEVMSTQNIKPTLANMFNFEADYMMAPDMFSVEENIVIFPNTNFVTDKVFYNASLDEYKVLTDDPISGTYIEEMNEKVLSTLETSNNIIRFDLIRYHEDKE